MPLACAGAMPDADGRDQPVTLEYRLLQQHAGDVVLQLSCPQQESEHARQAARARAFEAELLQALPGRKSGGDATRGADTRAELLAAQSAMARLQQRQELLTLRARVPGRLVLAQAHDLSGQFLLRGQLFGHMLDGASPTVRIALPEARIGDLDVAEGAITVRLSKAPAVRHAAAVARDSRTAVARLPSAALADRYGGDIVTDPSDPDGLAPREPVVVLDVRLDAQDLSPHLPRIGERAWMRFDAGHTPLALAAANRLRRTMLRHFGAAQ